MIKKLRDYIAERIMTVFGIKHLYYFVPQCPQCRSWKTGRYVAEPKIDSEYMYRKSLEHGELIRFVAREPIKNCYCEECGYEWGAHIRTLFLTTEEMIEQQRVRGTRRLFERYKEDNYINGKPPKSSAMNRWFF